MLVKNNGHLRNVLKSNSELFFLITVFIKFPVQFCVLAPDLASQWGNVCQRNGTGITSFICKSLYGWMIGPNGPSVLFKKQHSIMYTLPWLVELLDCPECCGDPVTAFRCLPCYPHRSEGTRCFEATSYWDLHFFSDGKWQATALGQLWVCLCKWPKLCVKAPHTS